jgi:hypothetical protein
MGCSEKKLSKNLTRTFMAYGNVMICQQAALSGEAERPKVADAVIEAYFRAGHGVDLLKGQDPRLFPYTQITDGLATGGRSALGEGVVPLREMLAVLPADLPLSLEWPAPASTSYAAAEWATIVLEHPRRYLHDYDAEQR